MSAEVFAIEHCFLIVLLIMLYKVNLTFSFSNGKLSFADQDRSCDSSGRPGS